MKYHPLGGWMFIGLIDLLFVLHLFLVEPQGGRQLIGTGGIAAAADAAKLLGHFVYALPLA